MCPRGVTFLQLIPALTIKKPRVKCHFLNLETHLWLRPGSAFTTNDRVYVSKIGQ